MFYLRFCHSSRVVQILTADQPQRVPSFRLPLVKIETTDQQVGVAESEFLELQPTTDNRLTVVCFLGTECPLAKLYAGRLTHWQREFEPRQVRFIGINSNQQDSLADVRDYMVTHHIGFPMAEDDRNVVADQFQAQRTPEVFVLDQELMVRYHGRIDDQYLRACREPTRLVGNSARPWSNSSRASQFRNP